MLSITERGTALRGCSIAAHQHIRSFKPSNQNSAALAPSVIRLNQPWITRLLLMFSKSNAVGALRPQGLDGPTNVKPICFCCAACRGFTSVRRRAASLEHRRRYRSGSNFARAELSVSNRGLES